MIVLTTWMRLKSSEISLHNCQVSLVKNGDKDFKVSYISKVLQYVLKLECTDNTDAQFRAGEHQEQQMFH